MATVNRNNTTGTTVDATVIDAPALDTTPALTDYGLVGTQMAMTTFTDEQIAAARAKMQAQALAVQERLTSATFDHVKFKGATAFILPDDTVHRSLDVVIVAFTNTNTLYPSAYQPGKVEPPTCYAIGQIASAMAPRANSLSPQHSDCATCPKNQFKSAPNGKGKACRNARRMAALLVRPGVPIQNNQMITIEAPPSSLKAFDRYVSRLASSANCLPVAVITRISLVPDSTFAELQFEVVRPLSTNEVIAAYMLEGQFTAAIDADIDYSSFNS